MSHHCGIMAIRRHRTMATQQHQARMCMCTHRRTHTCTHTRTHARVHARTVQYIAVRTKTSACLPLSSQPLYFPKYARVFAWTHECVGVCHASKEWRACRPCMSANAWTCGCVDRWMGTCFHERLHTHVQVFKRECMGACVRKCTNL